MIPRGAAAVAVAATAAAAVVVAAAANITEAFPNDKYECIYS